MSRIIITIPTFRRPQMLLDTLSAVASLRTTHEIAVIVADNDSDSPAGLGSVETLRAAGYRFPLSGFSVATRGHPAVRNALIGAALAQSPDYIILMDDDQLPEANYLDLLVAQAERDGADLVGPAVLAHFTTPPPRWAQESSVYARDDRTTGPVPILSGDGGILLRASFFSNPDAPRLDERFGLSGGADSDWFHRLREMGARFSRAADARIAEVYVPSRVRLGWALKRAYRLGNSAMRINRLHSNVTPAELLKIPGGIIAGSAHVALAVGKPGRQVDGLCRVARAIGKLAALFGHSYEDYRSVHGR